MSAYSLSGRVWLFPESDINTDQLMPAHTFILPEKERMPYVLESIRPGWSKQVGSGDVLVGGRNFGVGSGRPCGGLLRSLGIAAVVSDSINGLFLRNCINSGLVALACPGVTEAFVDGEFAGIDPLEGVVRNETRGLTLKAQKIPAHLLDLAAAGGVVKMLIADGSLIPPQSKEVR